MRLMSLCLDLLEQAADCLTQEQKIRLASAKIEIVAINLRLSAKNDV